jgi:iron(III) transport system permease protein
MAKPGTRDLAAVVVPALGGLLAVYLVAAPLLMLVYAAFHGPSDYLPFEPEAHWTLQNIVDVFSDPLLYLRILPDTLTFVAGTVVLTSTLAFTLAWLVERTDLPGRNVWFSLILLPLFVPIPVLAIAWILLFGPNAGWANLAIRALTGAAGDGPLNIFSMAGLIVCQSFATAPFVFLQLTAVLRSMSPELEEAAYASGASVIATFRRVTIPVLLPGLLAPVILVTLVTAEQFELPLIIGLPARINVFAYRIYSELTPSSGLPNYGGAAAISIPFLLLGLMALMLYNAAIRRSERFVTVTGKAFQQRRLPLGAWKTPALAFLTLYLALGAALPAAALFWTSLFGYGVPGRSPLSDASLAAYRAFLGDATVWRAFGNSLIVAVCSATLVTLVGALIAWIVVRSRFWGRGILDAIAFMSLGIPAVIAGLAVMVLYLSIPIGIYGTVWILVLAYSYRLAVATRISRATLMQLHRELEEAAEVSGARWLSTQLRIVLPLLSPALMASFLLLFIVGLREFTIPFVLHSQENVVLSVLIWQLFQNGQPAASAALGSMMIAMVLPMIFVFRRFVASRSPSR